MSALLLEIVLVLMFFHSLDFLHVRREANQTARYLVKYVLHNLDWIWIKETPSYIFAVLRY